MNIYKISNPGCVNYDAFIGAVVVAESPDEARMMYPEYNPDKPTTWSKKKQSWIYNDKPHRQTNDAWIPAWQVEVVFLGVAREEFSEPCVLMDSYYHV